MKRLLVSGLSLGLVAVLSVPAFAGGPRAADMVNAKDVWGGAYDNVWTNAVPDANGVVTTPAGGGRSPAAGDVGDRFGLRPRDDTSGLSVQAGSASRGCRPPVRLTRDPRASQIASGRQDAILPHILATTRGGCRCRRGR